MEFVHRNVGWRTILLVQFQPQYVCILLLGIYLSPIFAIIDICNVYITKTFPDPMQNDLLRAFEIVYLIDIITMIIYKMTYWEEAKQIFEPRGNYFVFFELLTMIPIAYLYKRSVGEVTNTYYYMRLTYVLRLGRVGLFFYRRRKQVGIPLFLSVVIEFLALIMLYFCITNMTLVYFDVEEGFEAHDFFLEMYQTISRLIGKGVAAIDDIPHMAMIPLLCFTFICYMIYIFYMGSFIAALIFNMNKQFIFTITLSSCLRSAYRWKHYSLQIYQTVRDYYRETWYRRRSLAQSDEFNIVIPEVMMKEIKLDICWDAFKHSHIFRDMETHYLRHLSTLTTITYFTTGELVFKKGKFKSCMIYIVSGVLQLLSEEDGETPILSFTSGTCLSETTLFLDQPSACSIVCKSFSEVIILKKTIFFKSLDMYTGQFNYLRKKVFRRIDEAKHYLKINQYQMKNSSEDTRSQVLTMKWLKKTLHTIGKEDEEKLGIFIEDRQYEANFKQIILCASYLDMMVLSDTYQLCADAIVLRYSCPVIFQPNSWILFIWNIIIAVLAYIFAFSNILYVSLSVETVSKYTHFVYFITIIWMTDVYIQCSTAIISKNIVTLDFSKIIIHRLSRPMFFVDIAAAVPLELFVFTMIGEISPLMYHAVTSNRILKAYRVWHLFDISRTTSASQIVVIKYIKMIMGVFLVITNLAGVLFLVMCPNRKCSTYMEDYLLMIKVSIHDRFKVYILCNFFSMQFIAGLLLGEYPVQRHYILTYIQVLVYLVDMYLLADVAAAETLRNKNKLKYHEFVSNVNIVMKQWEFDKKFKERVMKYCVVQWQYDRGGELIRQDKLSKNIPFELFKIGQHISNARSISHLPLFQQLPDEVLAWICVHMERIVIPIGEVITYSGEVCKDMYIIEMGYCEMIAQSLTTAKILGPGDSFSVIETCLNISTINTVITLSDCKILTLSYDNYLRIMHYYPHVLSEINAILEAYVLVGFEQLTSKDFLDIESFTPKLNSFNYFGYHMDKESKEYDEFYTPFNHYYFFKFFKFFLMHTTITPYGQFIKYWEWSRCFCASLTCILSPITIISSTDSYKWKYLIYFLDVTAVADIYVRHHISYFAESGIEITHPLLTAVYYWSHGFVVDLMSALPFEFIIPTIAGLEASARVKVFLRIPRLLQGIRVYNMFNYYVYTTGEKKYILIKYFLMVVYFQMICAFGLINTKCEFDKYWYKSEIFIGGVKCSEDSWICPRENFLTPLSPVRVYSYGYYFLGIITTFKGLEGFTVKQFYETLEVVLVVMIWLALFPYFNAKIIGHIMYRNIGLVTYQNAMASLVKFMKLKKIDPVLRNEVIDHFEYIWLKKKGRNESEIFKAFNVALHEDSLYHIYGKVMHESSIFRGASKSFFKSLLLNVKHEFFLKRGLISKVNNVHGTVYILFKGFVEVMGPDYNKLLTLPSGSVFGHLDNIERGRQTLSYVAKGHVELLSIHTNVFHSILAKYREIRIYFKSLTVFNVDYLINHNKVVIPDHIYKASEPTTSPKTNIIVRNYSKLNKIHTRAQKKCSAFTKCCQKSCKNCGKCCVFCCSCMHWLNFIVEVHKRGTIFKIWEALVLGGVCFFGPLIEFYQKSSHDMRYTTLGVLYATDILFIIKMYIEFNTAYDDERGLLVTNRKLIAMRYLKRLQGFTLDVISTIPIEFLAFIFEGDVRTNIFTYCRLFRLLRIAIVIEFFHTVNQKLNINVLVMRLLYLTVLVTMMLQFLVFFLFFTAKFDDSLERFKSHIMVNNKFTMYLRQIRVILYLFSGSHIVAYRPNYPPLIWVTAFMMIFTRFIIAIFIAETCATLQTVLHNKTVYETYIADLMQTMKRTDISMPLYCRVSLYVKLLWNHHKGEQFPHLLLEAPYYLREGVLNSMFGFHIRTHPLLKLCHSDMIRQMTACMTTRIFFSGDFIAFNGDIDGCMYFIHRGEIYALSDDSLHKETIDRIFTEGQMFGMEQGLYKNYGHTHTYRANSFSIVVVLNRKDWVHLLNYFPASKHLIFNKNFVNEIMKEYVHVHIEEQTEDE